MSTLILNITKTENVCMYYYVIMRINYVVVSVMSKYPYQPGMQWVHSAPRLPLRVKSSA